MDTEWDRKKDKRQEITVNNLKRIPTFQELCEKHEIKPIYFCTYEAIENDFFINYIKNVIRGGKCEIGAHLHPWSNPPFPFGDPIQERMACSFPHEYSNKVFHEKLLSLTNLIKERLNYDPISYRAGRFGFRKEHIDILSRFGYKIDSSITPYVSHSERKGWKGFGIDFSDYHNIDPEIMSFNDKTILEIPLTIIRYEKIHMKFVKKFIGMPGIPRWFRIYPKTRVKDLKLIIKYMQKNKRDFLVFMMHSNELDNESNNYFNTSRKVENLIGMLKQLFQILNKKRISSITFKDYLKKYNTTL